VRSDARLRAMEGLLGVSQCAACVSRVEAWGRGLPRSAFVSGAGGASLALTVFQVNVCEKGALEG
jgi:hypothetical protein